MGLSSNVLLAIPAIIVATLVAYVHYAITEGSRSRKLLVSLPSIILVLATAYALGVDIWLNSDGGPRYTGEPYVSPFLWLSGLFLTSLAYSVFGYRGPWLFRLLQILLLPLALSFFLLGIFFITGETL